MSTTTEAVPFNRVLGLHMLNVLPCKDYGSLEGLRIAGCTHLKHRLDLSLSWFPIVLLDLVLNVHVPT